MIFRLFVACKQALRKLTWTTPLVHAVLSFMLHVLKHIGRRPTFSWVACRKRRSSSAFRWRSKARVSKGSISNLTFFKETSGVK